MSFFQKLRIVTVGAANDLLDKAIDLNSPSAIRQYTRDLEEALDKLRNEAAVQAGQVHTLEREIGDLQSKIELGKTTITKLNSSGHPDLARIKATEIVSAQRELSTKQTMLGTQQTTSAKIDASVAQLTTKHSEMVSRVRELEQIDHDSKAKEQAAAALSAAGRLTSGGADISVDDVEGRMRARNDVASEKLNRAMGDVQASEDPETTAAVDDLMASLTEKKSAAA